MCGEASPVPSVYEMHKNNTLRTFLIKNKKQRGKVITSFRDISLLYCLMQFTQWTALDSFYNDLFITKSENIMKHSAHISTEGKVKSEWNTDLKRKDRCRQQKTHT